MAAPILLEILGKTYVAEQVGDCLRIPRLKLGKDGYLRVTRNKKTVRVCRALLGLTDPEIHALHSCDNRWCVNIEHLRPGSNFENVWDKVSRNGHRSMPVWQKNLYFEVDQAYGSTLAGKYLGKTCNTVAAARKTFFRLGKC